MWDNFSLCRSHSSKAFYFTIFFFFFFNDTATTEIYTLSLHDALPISPGPDEPEAAGKVEAARVDGEAVAAGGDAGDAGDRKSTRLNSSHLGISYAVFCLKKKNNFGTGLRQIKLDDGNFSDFLVG